MKDTLKVSEQGLRLIKAFEGFRPVDRELVSGARVVGYGHKVRDGRARVMSRDEAEAQLVDDLAPFEDMLNSKVYAPVNQAQFDALASLAFNIGPKAFLESDTLRALNAGRPLDAARGFDAWRLAKVGGETFVIDALVRRRTAEKALFLRPSDDALAPKAPTEELEVAAGDVADDPQPVLDRDRAGRLVSDAPYDIERLITSLPSRRAEDGLAGEMAESELPPEEDVFAGLDSVLESRDEALDLGAYAEEADEAPETRVRTAIADAADEVRDRLEALMEPDARPDAVESETPDLPESLIDPDQIPEPDEIPEPPSAERGAQVVAFPGASLQAEVDEPEPPETPDTEPKPRKRRRFRLGSRRKDKADAASITGLESPVVDALERDASLGVVDTLDVDPARSEGEPEPILIDDVQYMPELVEPEETAWVTPAPPVAVRAREASWPYLLFLVIGGTLFGTGAALRLRGADRIAGLDGELASLGLLMVGALILLGGLLYLVKALLNLSDA